MSLGSLNHPESPECIHNSAVHDEAFIMCFMRKFKRKRLNLLIDSKEKRGVLLLCCCHLRELCGLQSNNYSVN